MIKVKADVRISPDLVRTLIGKHYQLDVYSLEKVRAVYKVTTSQGVYGFKNAEELLDLPFIASCLQQIKQNGFTRVPGLTLTQAGELLMHHGGEAYFMEEWLDLREVPRNSFPYLEKIGIALADFHRASRHIGPPTANSDRFLWGTRHALLQEIYKNILRMKQMQVAGKQALSPHILAPGQVNFLLNRCSLAYQTIKHLSPQRLLQMEPDAATWCHGGLHRKNIMLDKKKRIWLIDFETFVYTDRVMDLAQLLQYHAPRYKWHPHVAYTFLKAYLSCLPRSLTDAEWTMFVSYLAFPRRLYNRTRRYLDKKGDRGPQFAKLTETIQQELIKEHLLAQLSRTCSTN
ncbi:phosphotransferase [Numidum massiliense]|uniref:phosphotransferase n=1 Tax=Numidum massiliense TaxID=1522315 RepID=UPI0006D587FF|nr:phosphotransferase [Numidum massiliense]